MFKYNTSMEKHKIFISGLPFSCTKEQLEEISKGHGTIKDVRLVTYRSGKPKVIVLMLSWNVFTALQLLTC